MSSLCCPKKSQAVYRPRRPDKTVLFQVIKKHYNTWRKNSEEPVPKYVEKEFQNYLGCGILAKGFACAHCASCNKGLIIPFSCKGRGICPACNARAMVETAANLVENLIPAVPIRQFVISFPMRIRHYLQTHTILQSVLRIVVDEIRKRLIACGPDIPNAQIGAVSFIQHFGNALNLHPHFHLIVADGIFSTEGETLLFHEAFLTPDDIADTQDCIRNRVLKYFGRRGWFDKEAIEKMLSNENSGFSLDAKVRIQSWDRQGLERLIRYCSRPCFASENLRWNGPWVYYRLPKPTHTGKTFVQLDPLEFIERISDFIPYPRRHRRHYHGVFAPNSPMREKVAASAQKRPESSIPPTVQEAAGKAEKVSFTWAKLIARIYETNPLMCPCGNEIKITAFVTHSAEIKRILTRIGWPTEVPEFDPPHNLVDRNICQLIPGTVDGFPQDEVQIPGKSGMDPPFLENGTDPPHWDDHSDPPHWED
ncbi:MAG TPA: transposase [Rhabdochlamydiaceae bacterium]|nr:transposase [Rhabdochlamydiaceae bacterium]